MASMKVYCGREKPLRAVGEHQCYLLGFAVRYCWGRWHTFNTKCRATVRAVKGLERRGCLVVQGDMFTMKGEK